MTHYKTRSLPAFTALLALLLGGCVAGAPEKAEDTRLDRLVAGMDQSLATQEVVAAQLLEQQRQLELQQERLEVLTLDVEKALGKPVVSECPPVAECPAADKTPGKQVVGHLEQVWFPDLELALPARIDTGAETASLDAHNIEQFERDGKPWVRFDIVHPKTGEPVTVERRLKRTVGIIQSGTADVERRPVVKMAIVIGHIDQTAEFSLSDRSHLDYQVMIGRNILKDVMVVDVSKKNIAPYVLPEASPEGAKTSP